MALTPGGGRSPSTQSPPSPDRNGAAKPPRPYTSMVMGLLPVVGVPLPLVSNGGTAMVSVMFACGLLIGVNVHRDAQLPLVR